MAQTLLDAGLRPALNGNRLVLGKLVLVRADEDGTKYAEEVISRGGDANFGRGALSGRATGSTAQTSMETCTCFPT